MHAKTPANAGDTFSIMCRSRFGGSMLTRLACLLAFSSLLVLSATAKDKKPIIPEDILRAQTVRVMVDPDAGEPLEQPQANATARDNVEKALSEWGRFRLVM